MDSFCLHTRRSGKASGARSPMSMHVRTWSQKRESPSDEGLSTDKSVVDWSGSAVICSSFPDACCVPAGLWTGY
jgi:hypothetical protein